MSKAELAVFSLVAPSKPLNNPLVSNQAIASPVGPNGQKLCFFYGLPLVGTFTAANDMPFSSILLPEMRIACSEDGGVVRSLVCSICTNVVAYLLLLPTAYLVAVRGGLVERAPHRLDISSCFPFPAP